ncbi:MAG: T9SS type A sorting domain-containing protein [Candidatus Krumholzibacteria bacterium]|nr:T9SS type A sorting domain-containing protein [Candidatus Krumholzibacteria bacterium]
MCTRSRLAVLTALLIVFRTTAADATTHQWSRPYGDAADQIATSVALDPSANVILTGDFNGTVDFGGSPLVCNGPTSCMYVAKIDALGNHVWSRSVGDSLEYGTNLLAVDHGANVFVANEFRGTLDFGGGPVVSEGFRDGVIAKFDAQGNHGWSRSFGSSTALVQVKAAGTTGAGNLVVAGTFTGTIDFGGAILDATPFTTNMFVVQFDSSGAHLWNRKYAGGLIEITALDADPSGNVVVTGYHGGDFDFGGGPLTADVLNVFIARYDASGNHVWSHSFGDAGTLQHAYDVAADVSGSAIITGDFRDPLDLGGGALISAGGWDIFLAKFDAQGNHEWSQRFGDASTQRSYTVAADEDGNIVIGGHFFGSLGLGGGILVGDPIDFCVARFDAAGNHLWSQRLDVDNLGLPNDKDYSISAAASAGGEMAFVGTFKDAVDCGAGNLLGSGGWDTFVAKFGQTPTGILPVTPDGLRLRAQPNPFNPLTTITYTVHQPGLARLRVYDVRGRYIRSLADGWTTAGPHTATWDGSDRRGDAVSSGVYFLRLQSAGQDLTRRVVLIK